MFVADWIKNYNPITDPGLVAFSPSKTSSKKPTKSQAKKSLKPELKAQGLGPQYPWDLTSWESRQGLTTKAPLSEEEVNRRYQSYFDRIYDVLVSNKPSSEFVHGLRADDQLYETQCYALDCFPKYACEPLAEQKDCLKRAKEYINEKSRAILGTRFTETMRPSQKQTARLEPSNLNSSQMCAIWQGMIHQNRPHATFPACPVPSRERIRTAFEPSERKTQTKGTTKKKPREEVAKGPKNPQAEEFKAHPWEDQTIWFNEMDRQKAEQWRETENAVRTFLSAPQLAFSSKNEIDEITALTKRIYFILREDSYGDLRGTYDLKQIPAPKLLEMQKKIVQNDLSQAGQLIRQLQNVLETEKKKVKCRPFKQQKMCASQQECSWTGWPLHTCEYRPDLSWVSKFRNYWKNPDRVLELKDPTDEFCQVWQRTKPNENICANNPFCTCHNDEGQCKCTFQPPQWRQPKQQPLRAKPKAKPAKTEAAQIILSPEAKEREKPEEPAQGQGLQKNQVIQDYFPGPQKEGKLSRRKKTLRNRHKGQ